MIQQELHSTHPDVVLTVYAYFLEDDGGSRSQDMPHELVQVLRLLVDLWSQDSQLLIVKVLWKTLEQESQFLAKLAIWVEQRILLN